MLSVNLKSRCKQNTVRRALHIERFPVRLQFHSQFFQLSQSVARPNLDKVTLAVQTIQIRTTIIKTCTHHSFKKTNLLYKMSGISLVSPLVFQVELPHHTESVISFQNDAAIRVHSVNLGDKDSSLLSITPTPK